LLICAGLKIGGGIVGTALGGLWAIILCALLALVGIGVLLSGGSDFVLAA
jgi:hypothetical protein